EIFNMDEFYVLAKRVIDEGDTDTLAILHELKAMWDAKYGTWDDWKPVELAQTTILSTLPLDEAMKTPPLVMRLIRQNTCRRGDGQHLGSTLQQ
ncbi:UNVERIFIED_CONTAM: hypothetical protein Sradi_5307600, partial [Sesamum radiatum]